MSPQKHVIAACIAAAAMSTSAARASVDFTTFQLNGSATATTNDLSLTQGENFVAGSGFTKTPISSSHAFSGSFDFTLVQNTGLPQADGVAFVIQSLGSTALGGNGDDIGAVGISPGVGIGFWSYVHDYAAIFDTSGPGCCTGGQAFSLGSNARDDVSVSFSYADDKLSFTATNSDTSQTVSGSLAIDLSTLGPSVFLGFTGGSGANTSLQDISNFSISIVPEPSTWAMMALGFAGLGFAGYRARRTGMSIA